MNKKSIIILTTLYLLFIFYSISQSTLAVSEITLNEVQRPQSAILFIVDGLGSSYYYPEFSPFTIDGSPGLKAIAPNLSFGIVAQIRTAHPVTGISHSVIVTGYSNANDEITGYPGATIFDITKAHNFVNLAIMEKGDSANIRNEQDIILFAQNNSIDEPVISIQSSNPPAGVYDLMYEWKMKLADYLDGRKGIEKYSEYNRWGIDSANALASYMIKNKPSQRFLLTVNVGAVDSIGHNRGYDDYIKLIERLDSDIYPLYETAINNNIALFLTADHGMSFAAINARRGGHSSDKYSKQPESLRIPLAILSPNTISGIVGGEFRQEDIAPTILGVLDLPDHLSYADGNAINIKKYATIFVRSDPSYQVSLWNNGEKISEKSDSELIFSGLALNSSYTIKAEGKEGTFEEKVSLNSDKNINFKKINNSPWIDNRKMIAIVLILIVNIVGLFIIWRIKS